ncbi:MAG TPA: hypothetical protein VI894_01190, partial [Candidatus Nanoarchaeia archaeon]|nr:hypothetical protein [Candidatus Nanoarchaeia archaeon]
MKGRNISIIVFDIVLLGVLVFGNIMFAKAYGGSQPAVAGHTLGEILPGTFGVGDYTFPQNLFVNGNLGVGTASPGAKLEVKQDTDLNGLYVNSVVTSRTTPAILVNSFVTSGAGADLVQLNSGGTGRFVVKADGNVG